MNTTKASHINIDEFRRKYGVVHPFFKAKIPIVKSSEAESYKDIKIPVLKPFGPAKAPTVITPAKFLKSESGILSCYVIFWEPYIQAQCGNRLRDTFDISLKRGTDWGRKFKFPFSDIRLLDLYSELNNAIAKKDRLEILHKRQDIKNLLSRNEYEFLIWYEWKLGMKKHLLYLGSKKALLPFNEPEYERSLDRETLGDMGFLHIRYLESRERYISWNPEKLFYRIF
ncbi:hypothetical protein KAU32_00810 [bacterium]|nr:hypothetical protein [bacterium]